MTRRNRRISTQSRMLKHMGDALFVVAMFGLAWFALVVVGR